MKKLLFLLFCLVSVQGYAQRTYWQQAAAYKMDINMNVETNQYDGVQTLQYTNNSPDTLDKAFYHLYFNAFQPGSMMDVRNLNLPDADPRVKDRISKLKPEEIGYQRVTKLLMNGKAVPYETVGTILEVQLPDPIMPGQTVTFEMEFNAQVPLQIRRSGRDNKEGIRYSMTQWYPKMAEYDYMGWHANPYIGREFYGIYGTFDVSITIDSDYIIGGTGVLQNPQEIGHGYQMENSATMGQKDVEKGKLRWNFKAKDVHDFAWAADPDYKHISRTRADGTVIHAIYTPKDEDNAADWAKLPEIMDEAFDYIEENFGPYPYEQYTFIQGGDGGMEYPMATLITGHRNLGSLVGVSVHELFHSWYQGVLGTNESLYAWMDEGFTSYGSGLTMNYLKAKGLIPGEPVADPILETVQGMLRFNGSGMAEPLSTHADHFSRNSAYGVASYVNGSAFLHQVQYIVGQEAFKRGMLRYYDTWKFKHPTPNDFLRIMEKESGLELDWFKEYFVYTTKMPNYAVAGVNKKGKKETVVKLMNKAKFPMPIDVKVTYKNGKSDMFHIPLMIMRGEKAEAMLGEEVQTLPDWGWVYPEYEFSIPVKMKKVQSVEIDPSRRMADSDYGDNKFVAKTPKKNKG